MAGKNNFKIFNESMDNDRTLNDSDYSQSTQRQTGVIPGVAQSKLHNKLFRQLSSMTKAVADFISGKGYDCLDTEVDGITANLDAAVKQVTDNSVATHNADDSAHSVALNFWQKSKVYAVGNIIFPKVHGSQYCFVCTQMGTSGTAEPIWVYTENTIVTDSTCKWTVSRIAAMRDFVFATTATALVSGSTGVVGTSNTYARGDHTHTLPPYPTTLPANGGNADTVDSCHAGTAANNVLKLGADAKVPVANLPLATAVAAGAVKVGEGLSVNAGVISAEVQLNILQRNRAYAVGDIAYSKNLPSWARLECVKAGTTASVEPQWTNIHGGGGNIG